MHTTFEQRANSHRVAYLLGAISNPIVVSWADREIEDTVNPPLPLIDLAMGRELPSANISSLLTELASDLTNDISSTQYGMSLLAEKARNHETDFRQMILDCHAHLVASRLLYDDAFLDFVSLEDGVSLIRDGIFGHDYIPELRDDFLQQLEKMREQSKFAG